MINIDEIANNQPSEHDKKWVKAIVKRLMFAYEVEDHAALAAIYDVHAKTPSNWIQRRQVPWPNIYACHKKTGLPLSWLLDGTTPKNHVSDDHRTKFSQKAATVMEDAHRMKLIKETKAGGFQAITFSLMQRFIEIVENDE